MPVASKTALIFTTNTSEIGKRLRELSARVKDRSKPAKQLAVQLYGDTLRNFNTNGALFKNNWPQLAISTQHYKSSRGWYVMLVRTGTLRQGFYQYSTQNYAAVGNKVPYASFHETGTRRMPRRQIMPSVDWAATRGVQVFSEYLKSSVKEVGL